MRSNARTAFVALVRPISRVLQGWNLSPSNALTCMDYEAKEKRQPTAEERAAKKEKSLWDAKKALAERKKADDAFRANFERLKAERLAREQKS
jgi:hypothetical protein